MTFPGPGPNGVGKVENRARMTRFWHPKDTHSICYAFFVVCHPYR